MKLFAAARRAFLHSIVLLFAFCSLLLNVPTALAASVYTAPVLYAAATAPAPTQTVADIDELIAYYRDQKNGISQNTELSIEQKKEQLKNINSEINALIQDKKALLAKQ
ncbi:MAG: hypothetical protein AN487_12950 [Anabaena sp. CRKS33]|jgi:hypothetical protein|nr:MAG: hypothetical protein AN487_12950 [Anabaena sp. CRKS33]